LKERITAVIPVFNPEPGLPELVSRLVDAGLAVVVVDDGSTEDCAAFERLPPAVTVLRHSENRGKGRAMKTALEWVQSQTGTDVVVFADGDGQHRIEDVLAVAERTSSTGRVTFGVRDFAAAGVPFRSWWGNRCTALEVRLLLGLGIPDTQTGLRAVPMRLVSDLIRLRGERFEYEAGWFRLLKSRGEIPETVPIRTVYVAGNRTSHFRPWRDTLLTQWALFRS